MMMMMMMSDSRAIQSELRCGMWIGVSAVSKSSEAMNIYIYIYPAGVGEATNQADGGQTAVSKLSLLRHSVRYVFL